MLFEPDRHEAICDIAWDASWAHASVRSIVRDIEQGCGVDGQWPPHPLDDEGDTPRTGFRGLYRMLMQWCHGAPGIVTALSDFPPHASADLDSMLIQAGHAIWQAGPLAKAYGLCHGTAGNGVAFLKLHERTGDPSWLARARSFAVHAIGQRERALDETGQGRHTLWTGDAGPASYLWQCVRGSGGMPGLDFLT